jgi:hypothetical protein
MAISNVTIGITTTQLFLSPTNTEQAVTTMFFCNTSATTDATIDIYVTPGGQAVGTSNQIIKSLPLPKLETFVFDAEKIILESGDSINAIASAADIVVATISSVQTS